MNRKIDLSAHLKYANDWFIETGWETQSSTAATANLRSVTVNSLSTTQCMHLAGPSHGVYNYGGHLKSRASERASRACRDNVVYCCRRRTRVGHKRSSPVGPAVSHCTCANVMIVRRGRTLYKMLPVTLA